MAMYLVSTKAPGLRFKVLKREKIDEASARATLLGDTGTPFVRVINGEVLEKYGYRVEKVAEAA
jgi:hypothetical protein